MVLLPVLAALISLIPFGFTWRYLARTSRPPVDGPPTRRNAWQKATGIALCAFLAVGVAFFYAEWWPLVWNVFPAPFFGIPQAIGAGAAGTAAVLTFGTVHTISAVTARRHPQSATLVPRSWTAGGASFSLVLTGGLVVSILIAVGMVALTATEAFEFAPQGVSSGSLFRVWTDTGTASSGVYPGGAYSLPVAGTALAAGAATVAVLGIIAFGRSIGGEAERTARIRSCTLISLSGLAGMLGGFLWVSGLAIFQSSQLALELGVDQLATGNGARGLDIPSVLAVGCGVVAIVIGILWCATALVSFVRAARSAITRSPVVPALESTSL